MIVVDKVTKTYDRVIALRDVSLSIKKGEWVSIMGPSGSGKTTLLNLIAGLDTPSSGGITVKGVEVSSIGHDERAKFRRENIGIIFQQYHLIPYLTAIENVMLAQYLHSIPDRAEAMTALEVVGIEDRADHLPSQLSGGEQQRVAIARAIINNPSVLLADEPTGNLDADNEEIVLATFKQLRNSAKTIVVVTHNPEVAETGDGILRIHHGRISQFGDSIQA